VVLNMRKLFTLCRTRAGLLVAALTLTLTNGFVAVASAAPSATTGVDYSADLVNPVKSELTLAIVAGLVLLAVIMAVKAGVRLVRSFGR
jgi:cell division protein FtsX